MNQGQQPELLSFQAVGRALRRRWWIFALFVVLAPAVAYVVSASQEKEYSASADLLFRDPGLDQKLFGSTFLSNSSDPEREAATNVRLVSLEVVAARTARRIGGITTGQIQSEVTVAPAGRADVASISVVDPRPALAARLANTFAAQYIAFRR